MTRSAEHLAARRAVARRHHPDVGGDPEVYTAELAAVERRFAAPAPTAHQSTWKRRARTALRPITRFRRRRYIDI